MQMTTDAAVDSFAPTADARKLIALNTVTLDVAHSSEQSILANLWELYAYDLSDVFERDLRDDGRYGNAKLPLYWSEPARRFPFLVRVDGRIAGFALATRGSPASENPDDFDVAEFFVTRRYRRAGVGRTAAFCLWDTFPVRWIVRVSEGNIAGCRFWTEAIAGYTCRMPETTARPGQPHAWRVFSLDSRNLGTRAQ
jgi:predicted acetyltransferase